MRYTITKIRNGCWEYENEKGVKTQHSLRSGAEKMAMDVEHFHSSNEDARARIEGIYEGNKPN